MEYFKNGTILDALPEGWVLAEAKDFYVDKGKNKPWEFKEEMQFIIMNLHSEKDIFEVYTITDSWNDSIKGYPKVGIFKLNTLLSWIQRKKCWILPDNKASPKPRAKPKPKKINAFELESEI